MKLLSKAESIIACHCIISLILFSSILKVRGAVTAAGAAKHGDTGFYDDENEDFELDVENPNVANSTGRDGRVFPFLAVVRLPPQTCSTGMVNGMGMGTGVCRTSKQCDNLGGTDSGVSCGKGYGTCCMLSLTCSNANNGNPITVSTTGTHITQPASYMPPLNCQFRFPRPDGVCQIRLDFVNFQLAPPNDSGDCDMDSFTVAGAANLNHFITCGRNNGQNLILDYGSAETITASVNLATAGSSYDILVNYVRCSLDGEDSNNNSKNKRKGRRFNSGGSSGSNSKGGSNKNNNNNNNDNGTTIEAAPAGCAQYFTTTSGEVRSFNYQPNMDPMPINGVAATQSQINNEMYTVCIKSFPGTSMITWSKCTDVNSFWVSTAGDRGGLVGDQCLTDYVDIPGGTGGGRYCGSDFPAPVTSTAMPYMLYVNFDDTEQYGVNAPIDPATGCPVTADCNYFGQLVTADNIPDGAVYPCPPASMPVDGQTCDLKPFFAMNADFANSGFCLKYIVS